jgi:hypothetical protein
LATGVAMAKTVNIDNPRRKGYIVYQLESLTECNETHVLKVLSSKF